LVICGECKDLYAFIGHPGCGEEHISFGIVVLSRLVFHGHGVHRLPAGTPGRGGVGYGCQVLVRRQGIHRLDCIGPRGTLGVYGGINLKYKRDYKEQTGELVNCLFHIYIAPIKTKRFGKINSKPFRLKIIFGDLAVIADLLL
jgi:hypothetical protein